MAKSPQEMMERYRTGVEIGRASWEASKGTIVSRWAEGLSASGLTVGPQTRAKMEAKLARAQYRAGDPTKWFNRMREGLAR